MRLTFTVHERLKREQDIKTLFQTGKAFSLFPLKVVWLPMPRNDQKSPARLIVSVPKKRIPHAVDRNRLKRLIRESWRLNKHLLYTQIPTETQYHIFFIFTGQIKTDFQTIETVILKAIAKMSESINTTPDA